MDRRRSELFDRLRVSLPACSVLSMVVLIGSCIRRAKVGSIRAAFFAGLCLLPILVRPLLAADDEVATSTDVTGRPIAAPLYPSQVQLLGDSSKNRVSETQRASAPSIPGNLIYLFDLPWCKRWRFSCMSCEKRGDGIKCFDRREACNEQFKFYHCEDFNLPEDCTAWRDGCNFCTKNGCTLMSCPEYLAPNRPSFWCTRYKSTKGGEHP
jgi:hypothetical protein